MRFPKLPPLPQLPQLTSRQSAIAAGACAAVVTATVATLSARSRAKRDQQRFDAFRAASLRRAAASDASSRALASSLADPNKSTLLAFYAPDCRLCAEMVEPLIEVATGEGDWLDVVPLDADDGAAWALESLRFGISSVPSYVLLDPSGKARGKSVGWPVDLEAAERAVARLVEARRPKGKRKAKEGAAAAAGKKK